MGEKYLFCRLKNIMVLDELKIRKRGNERGTEENQFRGRMRKKDLGSRVCKWQFDNETRRTRGEHGNVGSEKETESSRGEINTAG